ncbi:PqqD family protein [Streptomyces sp. NBC_01794]|uniref:PqqD family protein n=1 Tax=Streptomyces sp. NBC_01794 TaxID=2975942 RepID=UPI00309295A3|nr:PqqD family protein [Streptomyces sp. NBC_01794]
MTAPAPRSGQTAPQRTLGVRIRRVKGDVLIGEEDKALLLSGPAELIYSSLDGRRTTADIARIIAAEFGVDEKEALADVGEFLDDLAGNGLIEW